MTANFQEPLKTRFLAEGFLVLRSVLDPETDLASLANAWPDLIDRLAGEYFGAKLSEICPSYHKLDFPNRFASLVGATNGRIFDHIDPALNIFESDFHRWKNVSSAQIPELFDLIRNARILDLVETLIGPEISATPGYHLNIKLGSAHLRQLRRVGESAARVGKETRNFQKSTTFMHGFQLGETRWHVDGYTGLADDFEHDYVNVWVPLTEANSSNSSLIVLPRSHLDGYRDFPDERKNEAIELETGPGDIVIIDGKLFHASTPNRASDSYRLAFNMRYLPIGRRNGRPFLPAFVARSRENPAAELTDPQLWADYWDAALDYLDRYELPMPQPFEQSARRIARIEQRWHKLVPGQDSWLSLHNRGSRTRAICGRVLRTLERIKGHMASFFLGAKNPS